MKKILAYLFLLFPLTGWSQLGGDAVYEFLSIPSSARSAALGGSALAINDGDLTLANENPALLTKKTAGNIALEYQNYYAGINLVQAAYARHYKNLGTFSAGVLHYSSGSITKANEEGTQLGTYTASETAFKLTYNRSFDSILHIGATFKPILSSYDAYKSFGLAMDIGLLYTHPKGLFSASLLLRNMGSQISTYNEEYEKLPFEIQAGLAYKLEHAPFRLSLNLHNLETPDLRYQYSNSAEPSNVDSETETTDYSFMDASLRHLIIGIEFVPTPNFFVRGGFNYQRRQELALNDQPGAAGFSWGFGFRIKKLHFSYANARYNYAASTNHFTVTTNLNSYK